MELSSDHNMIFMLSKYRQVVKVKIAQSCPTLCNPVDCSPWNSPGQNSGVGSLSLLQRIFPAQGSNLDLPHCRQILYQLSHKGSPGRLQTAFKEQMCFTVVPPPPATVCPFTPYHSQTCCLISHYQNLPLLTWGLSLLILGAGQESIGSKVL